MIKEEVLLELNRVLGYIENGENLEAEEMAAIRQDTIDNYSGYFNTGYMDFRKSCTPDGTTIEWSDTVECINDIDGTPYIDCIGGFGTYIAGHRNPDIIKYVKKQLDRLPRSITELLEPLRGYACKVLAMITPGDLKYSFLTNGGAEAVEMALKMAILAKGPGYFISTVGGFHGKSIGAVSMTGNKTFREPYLPLFQRVQHVEYGVAEDLDKAIKNLLAVGEKVTAFIVEPVQGEAGIIVPPAGYLKAVREICDKYDVALIADEIQTGLGRTGTMWRCDAEGVVPDIMTFGKATSGGIIPVTGIISREEIFLKSGLADNPFMLGSPTFGGNSLACSAFLATVKYIVENDIPGMAAEKGVYFLEKLQALKKKHSIMKEVRGIGMMLAMDFVTAEIGWEVSKEIFARHVLVAGTLNNAKVIRIEPPAVFTYDTIDKVLQVIDEAISAVEARSN